jgi:hypothetical protein
LKQSLKKNIGKHCSNPQCFKEKNYKSKFSTNSILKKNQQKVFLEKIIKKKKKTKQIIKNKTKKNKIKNI